MNFDKQRDETLFTIADEMREAKQPLTAASMFQWQSVHWLTTCEISQWLRTNRDYFPREECPDAWTEPANATRSTQTSEERWAEMAEQEEVRQARRLRYLSAKRPLRICFFPSGNLYELYSPNTILYLDELEKLEQQGVPFVYDDSGKPCTYADIKAFFSTLP